MRTKDFSWKRCDRHLQGLGLRHRRVHDLRRTFLSLAEADGADPTILYWGTHGRPGDILGAYRDADWRRLCGEVARLRISRRGGHNVVVPGIGAEGLPEDIGRPPAPASGRKQGM